MKEKTEPLGFARTKNGLRRSLNQTHPFPAPGDLPHVPAEKLRPLPNEVPPAPYWSTAKNAIGQEYHAMVVPINVPYHVLDGLPTEAMVDDPAGLLVLEVTRLAAMLKRAEKERDQAVAAVRRLEALASS